MTIFYSKPAILRCEAVSFARDQRLLLEDVDFALPAGSCTAIIGPNGVGKTTLLRLVAGLLQSDSGEIWLAEKKLSTLSRNEIAKQIALAPQHLEIPFDFTVGEIVALGRQPYRRLFGSLREQDQMAIDHALDATNTNQLRNRKFNELSGGEKQRVKIALGLAQEPQLLLLDEPTQNLDIGRQAELLDLIRSLSHRGVTILAAMHDLALIEGTFSSVILLSPYRPMLHGRPADVLQPHILERAFDCPPHAQPSLVRNAFSKGAAV